jgi:arsenite methyltransferase
MNDTIQNRWAQRILEPRYKNDPELQKDVEANFIHIRNTVLQNAHVVAGETVLDVGCGNGLIAFEALSHVGEEGKVLFCDISQQLLEHCRTLARKRGVLDQCQFVAASADDLSLVETNSVDVVTTRSVLVYVKNKHQAFQEFYRVLKPRGRLSICEHIPSLMYPEPANMFFGYPVTPIMSLTQKVRAVYEQLEPPEIVNFGVHDLWRFVTNAGFSEMHLGLVAEVLPGTVQNGSAVQKPSWEAFLKGSRHPFVPTIGEAIQQALTADEAEQLTSYLRPLLETRQNERRSAIAYLSGVKLEEAV